MEISTSRLMQGSTHLGGHLGALGREVIAAVLLDAGWTLNAMSPDGWTSHDDASYIGRESRVTL
jgi:hypothetical protein